MVGKFAPLHRGHELVIERALALCDEVVVISYSKPEFPGCEPKRRAHWLAARFPGTRRLVLSEAAIATHSRAPELREMPANDADPPAQRRFVAALCRWVLAVEVDAVFTSEEYGEGFASSLECAQRERRLDAPSVTHIYVDHAREIVPVSATAIRANVHAHRQWLSPEVYAAFVKRVCILGGESSGKSTLAEQLALALDTVHVPEYGRVLWEERRGLLDFDDLRHIAERQVILEEQAAGQAREFLICDTSPLTTRLYSEHLFGRVDPGLERIASERRYDLTVLCAPDFPFVQDGTRQNDAFRRYQHDWFLEQLAKRGDAWMLAQGTVEERIAAVVEQLRRAPVSSRAAAITIR